MKSGSVAFLCPARSNSESGFIFYDVALVGYSVAVVGSRFFASMSCCLLHFSESPLWVRRV